MVQVVGFSRLIRPPSVGGKSDDDDDGEQSRNTSLSKTHVREGVFFFVFKDINRTRRDRNILRFFPLVSSSPFFFFFFLIRFCFLLLFSQLSLPQFFIVSFLLATIVTSVSNKRMRIAIIKIGTSNQCEGKVLFFVLLLSATAVLLHHHPHSALQQQQRQRRIVATVLLVAAAAFLVITRSEAS